MKIYSLIAVALISTISSLQAAIVVESPIEAKNQAQKAKTDLVVMAYGGDWDRVGKAFKTRCWLPSLKSLNESTFASVIEIPQNPDKATREKSEKEQRAFNLWMPSLPVVYLYDAKGFCYALLYGSSLPKSSSSLTTAVARLQALRKKRDELVAKAHAASGVEKAKLFGMAAEVAEIRRDPQLIKEIKKADPDDESGYVKRLTFSIWRLHDLLGKPKEEALAGLDKELASPVYAAEQKQLIYALRGTVLRRNKGTREELTENYQKMYSLKPDSFYGKAAVKAMKAYVK